MPKDNPRGFVEYRNLGGSHDPMTRKRRIKAGGISGAGQKFAGVPVVLVSGDTIALQPTPATVAGLPIIGIIRTIHNSDDRPLTHNLPSSGNFLAASVAGYAYVNEDPNQTYLVSTDATLTSTFIGQFVDVTASPNNTAAGRSGFQVTLATASNTAAARLPFQVIGIADNELTGQPVGGEGNQDVEVRIYDHAWSQRNKIR